MIIDLLFPFLIITLAVLAIRKLRAGELGDGLHAESVRRFFQYFLLLGLIVIIGIGFTGLLSRVVQNSDVIVVDQTALARNVSFVVVGVPLYFVIAIWTRRKYLAGPAEVKSLGWNLYFTLASLIFLIGTVLGLRDILSWATGLKDYTGEPLAQFVVWGLFWAAHWWINAKLTPIHNSRVHYLIGSFIGLITLVTGLTQLLGGLIERFFGIGGAPLFIFASDPIVQGGVTFAVGLPVWYLYWIRITSKSSQEFLWLVYVLLVGAGGGLVMAVTAASIALYDLLVWFLGNPTAQQASEHFRGLPNAAGAACAGLVTWWYHRTILLQSGKSVRNEVRRIYDYLMAGIGLIASTVGFAIVLMALVEALTESSRISGNNSENTLLAAATLLLVGGPVWWIYWDRIQKYVESEPDAELASSTRRIYLFLLFGIGGLTAVITLLVGVFFLFDDIFKGNFGEETLRRMRSPFGLLISAGAVAGYHWLIYRAERDQLVSNISFPQFILLVGPRYPDMAREIAALLSAKVQSWDLVNKVEGDWSAKAVAKALIGCGDESVIVLSTANGPKVISVERYEER